MSHKEPNILGGISSLSWAVGIVFIILKVIGVLDWTWVWVTSPLWGSLAVSIVVTLSITALDNFSSRR